MDKKEFENSFFIEKDFLPITEYHSLLEIKDCLEDNIEKPTYVHSDGSLTYDDVPEWQKNQFKRNIFCVPPNKPEILEPLIGLVYVNVLNKMRNRLIAHGVQNPCINSFRTYKNPPNVLWHRDHKGSSIHWKKYWIGFLVMYPLDWSNESNERLQLGLSPELDAASIPIQPNLMVAHSGLNGHGLDNVIQNETIGKDWIVSIWHDL